MHLGQIMLRIARVKIGDVLRVRGTVSSKDNLFNNIEIATTHLELDTQEDSEVQPVPCKSPFLAEFLLHFFRDRLPDQRLPSLEVQM